MWKCLWLQDSPPPPALPLPRQPSSHKGRGGKKKESRVDLQLPELLNSSDCPGGKEWIFFSTRLFPLSKSRRPIHHLTRYASCSQRSRGVLGVEDPRGQTRAWHVGRVVTDTFCGSTVSPGLVGERQGGREWLSQTESPRRAT